MLCPTELSKKYPFYFKEYFEKHFLISRFSKHGPPRAFALHQLTFFGTFFPGVYFRLRIVKTKSFDYNSLFNYQWKVMSDQLWTMGTSCKSYQLVGAPGKVKSVIFVQPVSVRILLMLAVPVRTVKIVLPGGKRTEGGREIPWSLPAVLFFKITSARCQSLK